MTAACRPRPTLTTATHWSASDDRDARVSGPDQVDGAPSAAPPRPRHCPRELPVTAAKISCGGDPARAIVLAVQVRRQRLLLLSREQRGFESRHRHRAGVVQRPRTLTLPSPTLTSAHSRHRPPATGEFRRAASPSPATQPATPPVRAANSRAPSTRIGPYSSPAVSARSSGRRTSCAALPAAGQRTSRSAEQDDS